jgi:transcriptional regulator with XRE-family HTH domain
MNLGEKIFSLRKEKKLSQEKLAELVGVSRQTISNWELFESKPNTDQLILLSKALDVSITDLLSNELSTLNERIDNTEKLVKKNMKLYKILSITIYFILLISLIIFIIFILNKRDFTNYYDDDFNCYNGDQVVNVSVDSTDAKELYINISWFEEKYYAGNTLKETFDNLNVLKKVLIKNGYICKSAK